MIIQYDENKRKVRLPTVTDDKILGFFGEYRFLSNFHICKVEIDSRTFWSSEAAYMSMKSSNVEYKNALSSPGLPPFVAKGLGHSVILRDDWDHYRVLAMHRVVTAKFLQNTELLEKLVATGDKYLEETNDWNDKFWGVCEAKGLNMLGETLMAVRKDFSFLVHG